MAGFATGGLPVLGFILQHLNQVCIRDLGHDAIKLCPVIINQADPFY